MFRTLSKVIAAIVITVSATGCAINQHHQAGNGQVTVGMVMQANMVSVASKNQEIGLGAIGGLVGALAGNAASSKQRWQTRAAIASISGAIGTATANAAAKNIGMTRGQEIIIVTKEGRSISIIQPLQNGDVLRAGDPVYVIAQGRELRARRLQSHDEIGAFAAGYARGQRVYAPSPTSVKNTPSKRKP